MVVCLICQSECIDQFTCPNCKHSFHNACIEEWWQRGSGCPVCRFCMFEVVLKLLVPDIPEDTLRVLNSHQKFNMCRLALTISEMREI